AGGSYHFKWVCVVALNAIRKKGKRKTNRNAKHYILLFPHFDSCSIDPYIFGNFETLDGGDSLSAKFRAFKFPESNYVLFVGTVNVCLKECKGVSVDFI